MKRFVKQSTKNILNLNTLISIFFLIIIIFIVLNPTKYSNVAFKGLEVWAKILIPSLFPFFVLTKLFSNGSFVYDFTSIFKKPIKKIYNCPAISSYIFFMSIITGYPVGAKLVADFYNSNSLTKNEAIRTLSFCANSGPMFILGSVAIGMFASKTMGIIIYLSHILGSLLNGLIYRNYGNKKCKKNININTITNCNNATYCQYQENNNLSTNTVKSSTTTNTNQNTELKEHSKQTNIDFTNSINSSVSSVLLIGGVVCFAFVLTEVITSSFFYNCIVSTLSNFGLNSNLITAIFSGLLEITKGCIMLSSVPLNFYLTTILCTFIISFGGISTLLQAVAFTKNIVPTKIFILQKFTHALCSIIICVLILL